MKNYVKSVLFVMLVGIIAFSSCSKEEVISKEKDKQEQKLTPEQIILKEKMNEAAKLIVQFSNEKAVQKEVQSLINLEMYNDDYLNFKDLLEPESNPKLKSKKVNAFATAFRKALSKQAKSIDFDLEAFLIENDMCLYVPYPLEDYPADKQTPTITFHPLDNDSVNFGYKLNSSKGLSYEMIQTVNETYSETEPVYIISPTDELIEEFPGNGGGSGSGTGGGTGNNTSGKVHYIARIKHMKVTEQFDNIFGKGSEIRIVFANGIVIDEENKITGNKIHYDIVHNFSRREIRRAKRKNEWKNLTVNIDMDWKEEEESNFLGMVEVDESGEYTFEIATTYKVNDNQTSSAKSQLKGSGGNDFFGSKEYPRVFFFASQENPSLEGHGTHEGNVIRKFGDHVSFTTQIIEYNE